MGLMMKIEDRERCVDCGDVRHKDTMCHTTFGEAMCPPCLAGAKMKEGPITGLFNTAPAVKHSHYKKPVARLKFLDIYRILKLYAVTDPCLQHIVKKALCAGQRGAKDFRQDVQEIADTAQRCLEMIDEDKSRDASTNS